MKQSPISRGKKNRLSSAWLARRWCWLAMPPGDRVLRNLVTTALTSFSPLGFIFFLFFYDMMDYPFYLTRKVSVGDDTSVVRPLSENNDLFLPLSIFTPMTFPISYFTSVNKPVNITPWWKGKACESAEKLRHSTLLSREKKSKKKEKSIISDEAHESYS